MTFTLSMSHLLNALIISSAVIKSTNIDTLIIFLDQLSIYILQYYHFVGKLRYMLRIKYVT